MRLFIAVNFDDEIKEGLTEIQNGLKSCSLSGNFTRRENLHLTLVFLGEVSGEKLGQVKQAMNRVKSPGLTLGFKDLGKFKRDNGDLWWLGSELNPQLEQLYKELSLKLSECGFVPEERKFKPHLTLARGVKTKGDVDKTHISGKLKQDIPINQIDLMKSERINGILTYTAIYTKKLS